MYAVGSEDDDSNNSFTWMSDTSSKSSSSNTNMEQKMNGESVNANKKKKQKHFSVNQKYNEIGSGTLNKHELQQYIEKNENRSHTASLPSSPANEYDSQTDRSSTSKKRKKESGCKDSEELLKTLVIQEEESQEKRSKRKKKRKSKTSVDSETSAAHENCSIIEEKLYLNETDYEYDSQTVKPSKLKKRRKESECKESEELLKSLVKHEREPQEERSPREKKKKLKKKSDDNGTSADQENCSIAEQNYCSSNIEYKYDSQTDKLSKSKKRKKENEYKDSKELLKSLVKQEQESSPRKKNNKTKKNSFTNGTSDDQENYTIVEEKFCAEETVVETRTSKYCLDKFNNHKDPISKEFVDDDSSSSDEEKSKKRRVEKDQEEMKDKNYNASISSRKVGPSEVSSDPTTLKPIKLSARLQFEDEDVMSESGVTSASARPQPELSSRLRRLLRERPLLRLLAHTDTDTDTRPQHLSYDSDDVWILKCAPHVDIAALKDTDISIDNSKCKVKIDTHTYTGTIEAIDGRVAILTSDKDEFLIKSIPVIGMVHLCKRIPKPHFVEHNAMVNNQTNFIPLPETKCRHPFFGANYKSALKLSSKVKARLGATVSKSESTETDRRVAGASPELNRKKKRKRKKEPQLDVEHGEGGGGGEGGARKRRRRSPQIGAGGGDDAWASEKAIEENLFNF